MYKMLPEDVQDQLRCNMITKVNQGVEFDYEVWSGQKGVSKMNVSDFSASSVPCLRDKMLYQEWIKLYTGPEWKGTDQQKNWFFIPMVTYKDAPGWLNLLSQGPPGVITPNRFALSIPHLGTLYESTKIVQQLLTPFEENQLAPAIPKVGQTNKSTLLAEANTKDDLQETLDDFQSWCGYKQVLGEETEFPAQKNRLLAQAQSPNKSYQLIIHNLRYDSSSGRNLIYYTTNIAGPGGHIMVGPNLGSLSIMGPGGMSPGDYDNADPDIASHLPPVAVDENGNFTISVAITNHDLADVPDEIRENSVSCQGSVDMATGIITSDCGSVSETPSIPPEPIIRCGNPDSFTPGSCLDPNAKEDWNPNDLICAAPFPIEGALEVNEYSAVMSQGQLNRMLDLASECRDACQKCAAGEGGCIKCAAMSPCEWQRFPDVLSRKIGVEMELPYLERIGHLTIGNYYRYVDEIYHNGEFTEANVPEEEAIYGLFDIFRPAEMEHFEPLQAKSEIGYEYSGAWANWADLAAPINKPFVVSPQINLDKGDFYYPWLGGIQWAKKCVSEGVLLPSQFSRETYCPTINETN